MVTKDSFLDYGRQKTFERLEIPGLGEIFLRKLSGAGRDRYVAAMAREPELMSSELVVDCVCDENGKRIFSVDDVRAVAQMPMRMIEPIVDAVNEANRIGPADEAIEEAEKN